MQKMTGIIAYKLKKWLPHAERIAGEAGRLIMQYYESGAAVETKGDGSPVTEADIASHHHIISRLEQMADIGLLPRFPIVSEENKTQPDVSDGKPFWTVDPLDGTKGFVGRSGRFFVKIALIENFKPVLGVIYEPATGVAYFSYEGGHSYRRNKDGSLDVIKTRKAPKAGELTTIFNRLHHDPAAYDAAHKKLKGRGLAVQDRGRADGSCSTAFHMAVASGQADIYVDCGQNTDLRDGNGFSWDYAPDWLILKSAGGSIIEIESGKEPVFNRPASRMNAMVGLGDKELGKNAFPEFKNDCV